MLVHRGWRYLENSWSLQARLTCVACPVAVSTVSGGRGLLRGMHGTNEDVHLGRDQVYKRLHTELGDLVLGKATEHVLMEDEWRGVVEREGG